MCVGGTKWGLTVTLEEGSRGGPTQGDCLLGEKGPRVISFSNKEVQVTDPDAQG